MVRLAETTALHGRNDELRVLEASLELAAAGRLQCALVEGEAGIGKSRILDAALGRAEARGFRTFVGRADEIERGRPFGPLMEALGSAPRADAIATLLAAGPTDPAREASLQFRLVDAFVDLVETQALAAPVAVAIDDLQWADPSTLLALRSVGRRLRHLPVAMLATLRPLPRPTQLQQLVGLLVRDGARHLSLGPLDAEAIAALTADLLPAEPTATLLDQIQGAGGNPLFVIELVRALAGEAAIEIVGGRAELREPVLPPSLRLTILRRLSFLRPEALELLRVASTLGSTFSLRDVATVMDRPTTTLVGVVSEALNSGVLVEREERLGFRHDLAREALYEDLPRDIRASLHREAGLRLAAAGAPVIRVAEQLALGARNKDPEAAAWLRRAAGNTASGNPSGAIGLLRRALELLPEGARDERNSVRAELAALLAVSGAPREAEAVAHGVLAQPHERGLEGRLRATLVQALFAEGRWGEIVSEVHAACAHPDVGERDRGRLLAESALARIWLGDLAGATADAEEALRLGRLADDPVAVCFALGHLASIADQRGAFHEGLELARRGVEIALRAGAADADRRHPHIALGGALIAADRLREGREALEEGRRLGERAGTVWDLPLYHSFLALPLYYLGEWDDALAEIEAGLALADELGSGVGRVTALSLRGQIAVHRGDARAARQAVGEATAIVERHGPQWGMVWLTLAHAHLLDAEGQTVEALTLLRETWDGMADGWVESALRTGPSLAGLAARAGDRKLLRAVAHAMEEMAAHGDVSYATGGALLCRALAEADPDVCLAAVGAYRPSERVPELAAACEEGGRLLVAAGRVAEGRKLFEEALTCYQQLGAARDLARALASMRELGLGRKRRGARKRPEHGWESLTPSEIEVVRLAAEGLTNPEIGQRLFISRRTVETHLAHVFRKLDLSSRVELAAEAARRDSV